MVTRASVKGTESRWRWPWHTLLLGAYPALFLFGENVADQVTLDPLWVPLLVCIGGAGALLLAAYALRRDWARAGLMATAILAVFFSFGHVWNLVDEVLDQRSLLAALWVVGGIALVLLAWRGGRWIVPATGMLNIGLAIAVLINVGTIAFYTANSRVAASSSGVMPDVHVGAAGKPDVYYICFDRYAGEETLRRFYHFDNTPFLDALEERGFSVAHDSWANYFKTALSMFSTMTMEHIDPER